MKLLLGYIYHNISANIKPKTGDIRNGYILEILGILNSFLNNFKASEKGCKTPIKPTLLGPFRN